MEEAQHGWELFSRPKNGPGNRAVSWPRVTITPKGMFGFNKAALEAFGNADHVQYLYDKQGHRIGFRPSDAGTKGSYKLRVPGDETTSRQTAASRFLKHYGITFGTKSQVYAALVEDGMLVVHLDDPMPSHVH